MMGKKKTAKMRGGGKVKKMNMGGRTGDMMYSRGYGVDERSKRMPTMLMDRGPAGMKKVEKLKRKNKAIKIVRMNLLLCVLKRKELKNN